VSLPASRLPCVNIGTGRHGANPTGCCPDIGGGFLLRAADGRIAPLRRARVNPQVVWRAAKFLSRLFSRATPNRICASVFSTLR
jgi:hypothetical protein